MKYSFLAIVIVLSLGACKQAIKGSNGEVYKSPSQYNDYIVSRQEEIMRNIMDFVKVSDTNLDSAEKMLDKYGLLIDTMVVQIKGMPAYKGDSTLRDAAINTFGFYKRIFANEYKQIIHIRQTGGGETEEGIAKMKDIVADITQEEEKYDKAFHNAQQDFAQKNHMQLLENKMQKKFDDMK